MSRARKNPIEKRLDALHDQWTEFALDPDARLLRWLVMPDELRMIDTFVALESSEGGSCPDLFLRAQAPFENRYAHGFVLQKELRETYAQLEPRLAEMEVATGWQPPPPGRHDDDVKTWLGACASLRSFYAELPLEVLAILLVPQRVADPDDWIAWLGKAVAAAKDPAVRLIVLDDATRPALDALQGQHPKAVVSTPADLDMPSAVAELARGQGEPETPGTRYRLAYVDLAEAAAARDLPRAQAACERATAIARAEGWPYLVVPVKIALGAAFVQAERALEAVPAFREAEVAAAEVEASDPKQGVMLRLQAQLGAGSALFAAQAHRQAAATYEGAVTTAERLGDPVLLLECWRMAAYCHERADALEPAWRCGLRALDVGEKQLSADQRGQSTLAYAGEGLLRVCSTPPYDTQARTIELRMVRLLGSEAWRPTGPKDLPYPPASPAADAEPRS